MNPLASNRENPPIVSNEVNAPTICSSNAKKEATDKVAKIFGAVAGSIAAIAAFFITLTVTASAMGPIAIPIALAVAVGVGLIALSVATAYTRSVATKPAPLNKKIEKLLQKNQEAIAILKKNLDNSDVSTIVYLREELETAKIYQQQILDSDKKIRIEVEAAVQDAMQDIQSKFIIPKNQTPEVASEQLKITITNLENQLETITNLSKRTEAQSAGLGALIQKAEVQINRSPNNAESKQILKELINIDEEIRKSSQVEIKEITPLFEQLMTAVMDAAIKKMTSADRAKVLAPYANDPKYAHLAPKQ